MAASTGDGVDRIAQKYAGAERALVEGTAWTYVLFVPDLPGLFGHTLETVTRRDGTDLLVEGIVISRNAHRRYAKLWLSLDLLERMTVIHEFGHEFGLVENPSHERAEFKYRHHCNALDCAMTLPTPRVILRNAPAGLLNRFLHDYCAECRSDIRRAQAYWRLHEREGPGFREECEAERTARAAELALREVASQKDFEALLVRVYDLKSRFPAHKGWGLWESAALAGLGRFDEAAAVQQQSLPTDDTDPRYWTSRESQAAVYMIIGRYEDAITLLDRTHLSQAGELEYEGCAFILEQALCSTGQYDKAISLIDEMLRRGNPLRYVPQRMRVKRAQLLRRSGRVDEAEREVAAGLNDRQFRNLWLEEAAHLRHVQGRAELERELWQSLLEISDAGAAKEQGAERAVPAWTAVRCLMGLGRAQEANARADALAQVPLVATGDRRVLWTEVPARAELHDFDRAADLIRSVPPLERIYDDPCQSEDLIPMRATNKYGDVFKSCPAIAGSGVH
jgi:pentatricopeptide repeat protein